MSESKPVKPMREAMPGVAAFIDAMSATFGREAIVQAMRDGARDAEGGRGNNFWATEGGQVIGNPWSPWPRTGPCMPPTKACAAADATRDAKPLRRAA
jgi:hypothetical protein